LGLYDQYKGIYGYRRLKAAYEQTYSGVINHKRIYRIMREMGIKSRVRRKRKAFSRGTPVIKPNILNQEFKSEKANRKWVTDITNLYYNNTKIYLCAILDLYNLEVLSYIMSRKKDNFLVTRTLREAINKSNQLEGTILHSDQGSQYTTEYYSNILKEAGITQSMSRRGNCLDNAPIECFFSHLKSELIYINKYSTEKELTEGVREYIKFYNNKRIQLKLKKLSPVTYRLQDSQNRVS
jgi:transposase InsO family protein